MSNLEGRKLRPLTTSEIRLLADDQKPYYQGEDSLGPYKIDGYGIKRREGERGGPDVLHSTTKNNTAPVKKMTKKTVSKILNDNPRWSDPSELLLAIANGDVGYINKKNKINGNANATIVDEIPLFMRVDCAKAILPYIHAKPLPELEDLTAEQQESRPKVMVYLGSNGRELEGSVQLVKDDEEFQNEEQID